MGSLVGPSGAGTGTAFPETGRIARYIYLAQAGILSRPNIAVGLCLDIIFHIHDLLDGGEHQPGCHEICHPLIPGPTGKKFIKPGSQFIGGYGPPFFIGEFRITGNFRDTHDPAKGVPVLLLGMVGTHHPLAVPTAEHIPQGRMMGTGPKAHRGRFSRYWPASD